MESRYLQVFLSPSEAVSGLENMQAIDGDVPKQQSLGLLGRYDEGMIPVITSNKHPSNPQQPPATHPATHPATLLIKHQKTFFIVDN
jgi:hypothetical protein